MAQILYRFFAIGMDIVPAAVIIIPVLLISQRMLFKYMKVGRRILIIIFGIYLSAVFSAVGIPSLTSMRLDLAFNLIPIIDIASDVAAYIRNTLLNVLLFVPLGFLMPVIWKEYRSVKKTVLFGLGLSAMVEILQMFTYRLTDIDDLIFNTAGAAAGYYIYILFLKIKPEKSSAELAAASVESESKLELPVVFATAFLVMFTLQPLISGALWSLLYS